MGIISKVQNCENLLNFGGHRYSFAEIKTIHVLKPYKTNNRTQYSADVGYSGINVSGGDSLLVAVVSQQLTPVTRNSRPPYEQPMDDSKSEYHSQTVQTCSDISAGRENLIMDVRTASTAVEYQDLTQYNESTSRLHNHCEQPSNVKGFPHIMLSTRRSEHEEWSGEQHQHHLVHGAAQYYGERESKGKTDCYNQDPSGIEAYNTTLLQQYRKQPCSMPPEQQETYATEFHQPLLPSVTSYSVYPSLLQKQRHYPFKHESAERLPSLWERKSISNNPAEGSSSLRQERDLSYLKPPPVDLEDLSDDERERMRVKRERNRVAAAKCRNRRRELLERLEKEAEQLEREQEVLRDSVKKLQAQKRKLGNLLEEHEPTCSNKPDETLIHENDENSDNIA